MNRSKSGIAIARAATLALAWAAAATASAQTVKYEAVPGAPPPPVSHRGVIPGASDLLHARTVLGEPEYEGFWYSYKFLYPVEGKPGLYDCVQTLGAAPDSRVGSIEAATIPEGWESAAAIREKLGSPEYELRMATWLLLDYSERGVRFAVDSAGKTIGVAYVPHGRRRVPEGERRVVDLSGLRQGPQPAPVAPPDLGGLRAGAAEVEISPVDPGWLPGPFAIHDEMKARVVVVADERTKIAIVGADLFGMSHDNVGSIRETMRAMGFDDVIVGMSHNHAAPDTLGVYGHYPAAYIAWLKTAIAEGILRADKALAPVKEFRVASRELPMHGARVIDLFRNARNPGIVDPTISMAQFVGEDGAPIATIVHFACHVESLADGWRRIGADFPGTMCDRLKSDGMGQAIFLNGALGGMVSGDNRARTFESSADMGERLARIVRDLATTARSPEKFAFEFRRLPLEIPVTNDSIRSLMAMTKRRKLIDGKRIETDMSLLTLGEAQFLTVPGELLPEVSFEIIEKMNGFPRMIVGLGNDEIGYIVPAYDFRSDYYEETVSMGAGTAAIVRDAAFALLRGEGVNPKDAPAAPVPGAAGGAIEVRASESAEIRLEAPAAPAAESATPR